MRNYFKEQKKNYEKCTGKVKIKKHQNRYF